MNVKNLFTITAVVTVLFAILFLLIPEQISTLYGTTANEASIIHSRLLGAAMLGLGSILWLARNSGPSDARRAIINGGLVYIIVDFIVALWAVMLGGLNALGWSTVVLLLLIGIGWIIVVRKGEEA